MVFLVTIMILRLEDHLHYLPGSGPAVDEDLAICFCRLRNDVTEVHVDLSGFLTERQGAADLLEYLIGCDHGVDSWCLVLVHLLGQLEDILVETEVSLVADMFE